MTFKYLNLPNQSFYYNTQYKLWLTTTPDDIPHVKAALLCHDTSELAMNDRYNLTTSLEHPFGIAHMILKNKPLIDFTGQTPSVEEIVTIFRTSDIEMLKNFFQETGDWVREKHGSGPWHYAQERIGFVLELYPLRITAPHVQTEIFLPSSIPKPTSFGNFEEDPDGRRVRFS